MNVSLVLDGVFGIIGFIAVMQLIAFGVIYLLDKVVDSIFDIWD